MGLYKRGRVWWLSFTYQGRHYRQSTETEDRKLAQRISDKVKGEIAEDKWFEEKEDISPQPNYAQYITISIS